MATFAEKMSTFVTRANMFFTKTDMCVIFFEPLLPYQILLHWNSYFMAFFVVCEIGTTALKILSLPCPPDYLYTNLLVIVFLTITETGRLYMAMKGNLGEDDFKSVICSLFLCPFSVLGTVYLLTWQVYVLRLDFIICVMALSMQSLGALCGLYTLWIMYRDAFCWY
ncbi:transmembrane protein 216-like [Schistocerca americana]|uniref:transmembrane protein 216-like n=1 Tax=Schistocerca americana TaxID=7009 RepID=UPI001F4FBB21|nr:transmembrane protein 216-like [Schistocerca americana]XP_047101786.1 transmembrane protein 216-like [Schistocerca piceifrons]XP_049770047.1 transmembrane protein 216-like [Schistocerca cancellata]XP_049797049.1 transmembrane protein 216-like [Schistocerca nitens]XP_049944839.1 transmembrane protein 216-like [Schistocerca serialis cubense]